MKAVIVVAKINVNIILFLKVLFLFNRTLLSKMFMLVVLNLSFLKSLFELISESSNVMSWSSFFTVSFKQQLAINSNQFEILIIYS